jgi:hypothetical protein
MSCNLTSVRLRPSGEAYDRNQPEGWLHEAAAA